MMDVNGRRTLTLRMCDSGLTVSLLYRLDAYRRLVNCIMGSEESSVFLAFDQC